MNNEINLSLPQQSDEKALWEKALKKALEIALEKPHLDMLRRNGVLPDADKPWNVFPQKEEPLLSPKPATPINENLLKTSVETIE